MTGELDERAAEASDLQRELRKVDQERMETVSSLQRDLERLGREREGERRREGELKRTLEQSESVRRSLLAQVEMNGEELEKMTEKLSALQERESEAERSRSEAAQLHHMVRISSVGNPNHLSLSLSGE